MDVEIRTIAEDEFEDCHRAIELSFSSGVSPEDLTIGRLVAETDRCLVAVDQGRMIGGTMAASLRFTVPGGAQVRTAAVIERWRPTDASPSRDQHVADACAVGRRPVAE